jgi:hypothetical protein
MLRVGFLSFTFGSSLPFFSGLFYDVPCACSFVFTSIPGTLYFAFSL